MRDGTFCVPSSTAAPTVAVVRTTNTAGANFEPISTNSPKPMFVYVLKWKLITRLKRLTNFVYRSLWIDRIESNLKILERLAEKGHLQNTKKCEGFEFDMLHTSSFLKVICSMKNLEKLTLKTYHLTLEDLAPVFQSCSNLIELNIFATGSEIDEMGEVLIDQLRSGFRRLRRVDCSIVNNSWPGIPEMLS